MLSEGDRGYCEPLTDIDVGRQREKGVKPTMQVPIDVDRVNISLSLLLGPDVRQL